MTLSSCEKLHRCYRGRHDMALCWNDLRRTVVSGSRILHQCPNSLMEWSGRVSEEITAQVCIMCKQEISIWLISVASRRIHTHNSTIRKLHCIRKKDEDRTRFGCQLRDTDVSVGVCGNCRNLAFKLQLNTMSGHTLVKVDFCRAMIIGIIGIIRIANKTFVWTLFLKTENRIVI